MSMTGYIDPTLVLKTRDKEKVRRSKPKGQGQYFFLQQHGSMNKASASSPDQAAAQFFRDQDVYFKIKGSNTMLTWRI